VARIPQTDSLPSSPVDWVDIPLGPGQQPNANGKDGSFQYTKDANSFSPQDSVRRNPDETWQFIVRIPERP